MAKKNKIDEELTRPIEQPPLPPDPTAALSSGCTVLNLAMTGRRYGAFHRDCYYGFVGDSDSGKSVLTMTCFAEAMRHPLFKDHRLIHDNIEDGVRMDVSKYYGRRVNERIEPPRGTRLKPQYSQTVEDLYFGIDRAFDDGRPFLWVVDSMDGLSSKDDQKKHKELREVHESGSKKKVTGSYGMAKAKLNSSGLRAVQARLPGSGSIIIFISQTRDNVDVMGYETQTYGGGRSLKFYAAAQMWTSCAGSIKKTVKDIKRDLGIYAKIRVRKNRQTGRKSDVEVPIYWATGIDDTGACVQYLIDEGHWKKSDGRIVAPEFSDKGLYQEDLIVRIETTNQEEELRELTEEVWLERERMMAPQRKMRYSEEAEGE